MLTLTYIRGRLAESVRVNQLLPEQATAFVWGTALGVGSVCFALGAIALVAGYRSPLCFQPFSFNEWGSAASNVVTFVAWAALLGWVWLGSGAEVLGRVGPALMKLPDYSRRYSPWMVRAVVTGLLAVAATGSFVNGRSMPRRPACSQE